MLINLGSYYTIDLPSQNLLRWSQDFTQVTNSNNIIITPNALPAPDGTMTSTKVEDSNTTDPSLVWKFATPSSVLNQVYTSYAIVKYNSGETSCSFNTYVIGESENNLAFDLISGNIISNSGSNLISAGVVPRGDGWFMPYQTFTALTNNNTISVRLWPNNRGNHALTGSVNLFAMQITTTDYPLPYTKTESSAVV